MSRKNKPATTDPFEEAFFDYLGGDTGAALIIHSNKGEPELVPVHYFFRSYHEMPELEKEALAQCTGKVLDVGAGAGSHSLYLQQQGVDVTALEIRSGFVEVMKKRGVKKVILMDIMDHKKGKYDTLLLLMNGIGIVNRTENLESFLKRARSLLNQGGQILLDSTDLLYFYQQEGHAAKIDLHETYYGEVEFRVEYRGLQGEPFSWLYIDYSTLAYFAEQAELQCEMLMETELFNYLARLYV